MKNRNALGIVLSNENESLMPELTSDRSMASVPFGGRYRLIDFALSNLVNAGVSKVGIITKSNYQSLMDHIGNAKPWDLDRKAGGLHILPPYSSGQSAPYTGKVDALLGVRPFFEHSPEQYVVVCGGSAALNIDIAEMIEQHIETGADMTVAYKHGILPCNAAKPLMFSLSGNDIVKASMPASERPICDHSLGIIVIAKALLLELVEKASAENKTSLERDIIMANIGKLSIKGYEFKGFAAIMDSSQTYVQSSMELLNPDVRADLFNASRPIYTKLKDAMPTRYGIASDVSNSFIADGCVIEGTVKNSILFRGVRIDEGATVENCIIMQGTHIGKGASVKYVTVDKEADIGPGRELCGAPSYFIFVKKRAQV